MKYLAKKLFRCRLKVLELYFKGIITYEMLLLIHGLFLSNQISDQYFNDIFVLLIILIFLSFEFNSRWIRSNNFFFMPKLWYNITFWHAQAILYYCSCMGIETIIIVITIKYLTAGYANHPQVNPRIEISQNWL